MADTMLHQSHPLAALAAGLVAEPDESWEHLKPLRFGHARRRLALVQINTHPRQRVRTRTWQPIARHSTYFTCSR